MIKRYKINQHNSTVCGSPGRNFDWSKFDWEGGTVTICGDNRYIAPKPFVDDFFIEPGNQYLHVAYDFAEDGRILRVRPNESMRSGKVYRGKRIISTKAINLDDGWYWELEFEAVRGAKKEQKDEQDRPKAQEEIQGCGCCA